ncbi:MAG: septal ring lytic transglycosylase RlpA family protein [Ignavibacteriaceae bacterium]
MNSITKFLLITVMILLVGFTVTNEGNEVLASDNNPLPASKTEADVNTSVVSYIDKGEMVASWYGPRFHGRKTANGERYDQMALTAAHKQLRFGTLLRVTNPSNNKSIIVRINDRGPYIKGRNLDLSKASAMALGMMDRGVAKVKVEQVSLKGVNFPVITLN